MTARKSKALDGGYGSSVGIERNQTAHRGAEGGLNNQTTET